MVDESALDIIIVDNDLDIQLALSAMLKELAQVNISVAVDGPDATTALASKRFDILFLDLRLSLAAGAEILDAVAAGENDIQRPTHIIVMSAASRLQEMQTRLSAEVADGILEKPFQYEDLQAIIANVRTGDSLSDF